MEQPRHFKSIMGRGLMLVLMVMLSSLAASAAQAYACYTPGNTTLTFYYDNQRPSRPGTTYDLNVGDEFPAWCDDGNNESVTKVVFNSSFAGARPTSTYNWFYDMYDMTSIEGIQYLNTSEVTNMNGMFMECGALTSIDLSHFNTRKVTDMSGMFLCCYELTSLDLSSFNTRNVKSMSSMFEECNSLTSINLSNFNTYQVTDMSRMFSSCNALTSLDLGDFDTHNVTDMSQMFNHCNNLKAIYVGDDWTTAAVTNSDEMFYGSTKLVGGMGTTYHDNHVDGSYAHIDGGPSIPGYLSAAVEPTTPPAYVVKSTDGKTLTFYCDDLQSTRPGTVYLLNTENEIPGWSIDYSSGITTVVFDPSFANARPKSTEYWFFGMDKLTTISGIEYLNTSKVTSMAPMFASCNSLTSLDVSGFDTRNVTDMSNMFWYCSGLTSLDVSGFDTHKVTSMSGMFYGCSSLTSLDLSGFDTRNVTHMTSMFLGCSGMTSLDLSSFAMGNVTIMGHMFQNCSGLRTIIVGGGWGIQANAESADMFDGCTNLVGGQGTAYDANHVDKEYAHVDFGSIRPGYLTGAAPYAVVSADKTKLTFYCDNRFTSRPSFIYLLNEEENEPDWGTHSSTITTAEFDPSFASARPTSTYAWFKSLSHLTSIIGIEYLNTSEVTTMGYMFYYCYNLTSLDVSGFDTHKVANMGHMFYDCYGLTSLDVSGFDTYHVTDMSGMFEYCSGLTNLDVSGFDTYHVTDMSHMFESCNLLTSLDLSGFDTHNVTNMKGMFYCCFCLTSLDVSGFDTHVVTNMSNMFHSTKLASLDLSNFDTRHVTNMNAMFESCLQLESLDLSGSFDTHNVTNMEFMLSYCTDLTSVYVGDAWSTDAVTNSYQMFLQCENLVGGQGTTFDANHIDAEYAHVDGGPSNPGYFIYKPNYVRGDVNGNGVVNIADVTDLIDLLLSGDTTPPPAADCNQDGNLNINDVVDLIDYLLTKQWN